MDFDVTAACDFSWDEDAPDLFLLEAPAREASESATATPERPDYSDDAQLLAALREQDEDAFAWLMRAHGERMTAVARRYFSEEEDARDAVQEAFVSVFRSIRRFEGKSAISTWLHRIVVNACLMKLRTRRRKPEQTLSPAIASTLVIEDTGGAQRDIEREQISSLVQEAIAALPEPHRSVIRLRDLEERDTRETAEALVISTAAVKTRLHRARNLLRQELEARGEAFAQSA